MESNIFKFKVGTFVKCTVENDISYVIKQQQNNTGKKAYLLCNGNEMFFQDEEFLIEATLPNGLKEKVAYFLRAETARILNSKI